MKKHRIFALALSGVLCLIVPDRLFAQSDPDSIEAQLEALEADVYDTPRASEPEVTSVASAVLQSMNPDISFTLDLAGVWFFDEFDLRGGHDPCNFGFNLQGLELVVGSDVGPYFRFDSAIAFHLGGVEIEEVYVSTLVLPAQFQVRVGQFNIRFGRLNPTHLHQWSFVDQNLVNKKFLGGEGLRGLGAELSQLAVWMPGTFRWYVAAQNLSGGATGRSFVL